MSLLSQIRSQEHRATSSGGFSLLELVAVVSILSILAGISIPAFLGFIKSARIDQAKATLNSAIAECLQNYRTDPDNADTATVPESRLAGLETAGYVVTEGKNKCSDFMIEPKEEDEDYQYSIGFMVRNGKVEKVAVPATNEASRKSCEAWGTCGIPPELQAEWDRQAAIAKAKKECTETFYTWLRKPSSGSNSRWDETKNSCSLETWAFEGSIQANEAGYKEAEKRKYGEICAQKTQAIKDEQEQSGGPYKITECGEREFYFCLGEDKGTKEAMDACLLANKEAKCIADENTALTSGHEGQYGPYEGPGQCGNIKWMCQGVAVDTLEEFAILQQEKKACGYKPPGPDKDEVCSPPPSKDHVLRHMLTGHPICNKWAWCNDLTDTINFSW